MEGTTGRQPTDPAEGVSLWIAVDETAVAIDGERWWLYAAVDSEPRYVERNDNSATQLYTSGTTGKPKGVLSTHIELRTQAFAGLDSSVDDPDERTLVFLPLYHTTGVYRCTWQSLVKGDACICESP